MSQCCIPQNGRKYEFDIFFIYVITHEIYNICFKTSDMKHMI